MKTKHSIGVINLRHQPDHKTPKKIHLFQEYGANPDNDRLFLILNGQREIEMI